jgi:hypothetical protein
MTPTYYIFEGDLKRFERRVCSDRIEGLGEKDSDDRLPEGQDPLIFLFVQQIPIIACA